MPTGPKGEKRPANDVLMSVGKQGGPDSRGRRVRAAKGQTRSRTLFPAPGYD
jgi:hypothetical protein